MICHAWMRTTLMSLAIVIAASCGGSKNSGSSPTSPTSAASTTFQGTIAGSASSQSGTLAVTVQTQVAAASPSSFRLPFVATLHAQGTSVTATGSLRLIGGSTTSLTGTYDSSSRALNLSGSGFALAGSASGAVITGSYTGPNNATGTFASRSTASGTVTAYCGNTFGNGPSASEITGVFNFVVSDASGAVSGTFSITADSPPTVGTITGQVTGGALSFTFNATAGRFAGESGAGSGTIQGGSVSGSAGGAFSGSTSRCSS